MLAFADKANFAEKIRFQLHAFEELTVILDFELDKEEQYELNEPKTVHNILHMIYFFMIYIISLPIRIKIFYSYFFNIGNVRSWE